MKKLLVISDTHGNRANMANALSRCGNVDIIIHLGDYNRDADYLRTMTQTPVYSVRGNCDLSSSAENEWLQTVEGVRILAVHGHKQGVKMSLLSLGLYAQEKQANLALFGHTHVPRETMFQRVRLYNPGSLGEPRGRRPSVGLVTLEGGKIRISTIRL